MGIFIAVLLGIAALSTFTLITMCALIASGQADRAAEKQHNKEEEDTNA